jgi:hypothetical protein
MGLHYFGEKMIDTLKQKDQIGMLEGCIVKEKTGEFPGMFAYPGCGYDLVQQGLATEDQKITIAGRALLWHLDKGEDPTESASSVTIDFKLGKEG